MDPGGSRVTWAGPGIHTSHGKLAVITPLMLFCCKGSIVGLWFELLFCVSWIHEVPPIVIGSAASDEALPCSPHLNLLPIRERQASAAAASNPDRLQQREGAWVGGCAGPYLDGSGCRALPTRCLPLQAVGYLAGSWQRPGFLLTAAVAVVRGNRPSASRPASLSLLQTSSSCLESGKCHRRFHSPYYSIRAHSIRRRFSYRESISFNPDVQDLGNYLNLLAFFLKCPLDIFCMLQNQKAAQWKHFNYLCI